MADLFREHRHQLGALSGIEAKVVQAIIDCRTAKLGGHVRRCDRADCAHEEISYNSCRNRHCPKCQFLARAKWVDARISELLPVEYFHTVFTLPHELIPLVRQNKKVLYDLLFRSASETLKEVMERRLQAEPGFIAVLHTWDQKLKEHPHLHVIVPGGGLKNRDDGTDEWVSCKSGYLLPIAVLTKVFRGKFLSGLEKLRPELKYTGGIEKLSDPRRFKKLLQAVARKEWVVYAKPPFAGPEAVIKYLGSYTHRIAISNYRLIKVENGLVYFRYRDSRNGNKRRVEILPVREFLRRFLTHVLPRGFVRIRHYGFLGNRYRKSKTERLRKILIPKTEVAPCEPKSEALDWKEQLKKFTGVDVTLCPKCGCGKMIEIRTIESYYERRKRGMRRKSWDTS
jgi:hypothetical protein